MNIGKYSIEDGEIVIRLPIKVENTVPPDARRLVIASTHGRESFNNDGVITHVNANVWVGDTVEREWAVGEVGNINKRIRKEMEGIERKAEVE